jgi:hypothetical protein
MWWIGSPSGLVYGKALNWANNSIADPIRTLRSNPEIIGRALS